MYAATINEKLGHTFQKDLGGINGRLIGSKGKMMLKILYSQKTKVKIKKIKHSHLSLGIPIFMTAIFLGPFLST